MRLFELGRIAAQAEALRYRRLARRQVMRGVYGAVAAVFAIGVLVCLHIAGALALVRPVGALWATLIVGAVDLVVAGICGALAAGNTPDRIEREAIAVSREARAQMAEAAVVSALVLPALRRAGLGVAARMIGRRR